MQVRVEGYSGYKADERPRRFCLGERWYEVREVLDRWYGPDHAWFRVEADDGDLYVLRLDQSTFEWSLAAYGSSVRRGR